MRTRWSTLFCALFALLGSFAAACGDDDEGGGGTVSGDKLTIYSSLPLQGPSQVNSQSVNKGAKLALKQSGTRIGKHTIELKILDDAIPQSDRWHAGKTQQNARQAVQDDTTIAYMGEFDSEATAKSLPILNRAGILQVSPANTAIGLTLDNPVEALEPGEPAKYYPTGKRTYGRVVPNDTVQAAALATLMKADGCTTIYIANDGEAYGEGLARAFEEAAPGNGLEIIGNEGYDPEAGSYGPLGSKIDGSDADCFLGSAMVESNAVPLFEDVAAAAPDIDLYGPHRLGTPAFYRRGEGGIPTKAGSRTKLTSPTLAPGAYPPKSRKFFDDYEKEYGEEAGPYAIYGFEAMSVIVDSIERAGERRNDLQAVIDAFYTTEGRQSVLGTYDIDENGDTTLTDYGAYTIEDGKLTFAERIEAQP